MTQSIDSSVHEAENKCVHNSTMSRPRFELRTDPTTNFAIDVYVIVMSERSILSLYNGRSDPWVKKDAKTRGLEHRRGEVRGLSRRQGDSQLAHPNPSAGMGRTIASVGLLKRDAPPLSKRSKHPRNYASGESNSTRKRRTRLSASVEASSVKNDSVGMDTAS
ncbi:hypothetical protein ARMGADRAFT_1144077 [Armillaria gallica]|uniref:Uncharacterized protein n=1 Tax=Armillaria gallica TaxID=47427 RepID=A0A2H3CF01_ARMGA|nr:hypothetical protein ARMGADRAFT_1144077 [Armillaria gallica]